MLKSELESLFLLTSVDEDGKGIGTLFLKDLIKDSANVQFYWFTSKPFFSGLRLLRLGRLGGAVRSVLARFSFWQTLRIYIFRRVFLSFLVSNIEREIKKKNMSVILLTASSPEVISIGRRLVENGWPVMVLVWDDPDYLGKNLRFNRTQQTKMHMDFDELMSGALCAGVISDEMQLRYAERYKVQCQIIRHGTKKWIARKEASKPDCIRVVFAGSLYSKKEWNAFVDSLDRCDWSLSGRSIELTFLGAFPLAGAKKPAAMTHIPHMPHSAALELMQDQDIGYLPYWFDPSFEIVARTSFPGKMTSYAAAGLLVFHHAPIYSSVNKFIDRYPFGICCSSLEPSVINDHLEQLVAMLGTKAAIDARENAMHDELSDAAMSRAFQALLVMAKNANQLTNL